ncbi:MAG: hypothetical protein HRT69_16490 [Flavobacteriaceae bacterium]|nr:hypothetical protein [Flavobacteriaceae bacterium]
MTRIHIYSMLLAAVLLSSCASIPASTTTLTQEILKESSGMHTLNISLINQLYANRKEQINSFITNTYTPALLDNFSKNLPDSLDYKEELPNILKSIVPIINKKKDSMQSILDTEQGQLITQLNANYTNFSTAGVSLQNLIDSAVKLKTAEKSVMTSIQSLTNGSVNISNTVTELDSLLIHSGNSFSKLLEISSALK